MRKQAGGFLPGSWPDDVGKYLPPTAGDNIGDNLDAAVGVEAPPSRRLSIASPSNPSPDATAGGGLSHTLSSATRWPGWAARSDWSGNVVGSGGRGSEVSTW